VSLLPALVVTYVLFGLDLALRPFIAFGNPPIEPWRAPYFVLPFVVFIALNAAPMTVLWASLSIGLLTDLISGTYTLDGGLQTVCIVGPNALGYLAAGWVVLTTRAIMMRRNPLTFIFLSMLAAAIASLVAVGILACRQMIGLGEPIRFVGTEQLSARLIASLLTGISATVLLFVFRPLTSVFGFDEPVGRRYSR